EEAPVVGDVDGPVGTHGGTVGPAAGVGHLLGGPVGVDASEGAALDLGQDDRAVRHGDRPFRELQTAGHLLERWSLGHDRHLATAPSGAAGPIVEPVPPAT